MFIVIFFVILGVLGMFKHSTTEHSFIYLVSIAVAAGLGIISILHYNFTKDYPPDWQITRHILLIVAIICLALWAAI
jgi:protein-S-isoprenylcysteine O-methyltransferase Ste14